MVFYMVIYSDLSGYKMIMIISSSTPFCSVSQHQVGATPLCGHVVAKTLAPTCQASNRWRNGEVTMETKKKWWFVSQFTGKNHDSEMLMLAQWAFVCLGIQQNMGPSDKKVRCQETQAWASWALARQQCRIKHIGMSPNRVPLPKK